MANANTIPFRPPTRSPIRIRNTVRVTSNRVDLNVFIGQSLIPQVPQRWTRRPRIRHVRRATAPVAAQPQARPSDQHTRSRSTAPAICPSPAQTALPSSLPAGKPPRRQSLSLRPLLLPQLPQPELLQPEHSPASGCPST